MKKAGVFFIVAVFSLTSLLLYEATVTTKKDEKPFSVLDFDSFERDFIKEHTAPLYKPFPQNMTLRREYLADFIGKENVRNGVLKHPSIYLKKYGRLGNNIVQLSNTIFLSEALNVSTIYIDKGFCLIKKRITTSKGIKIIPTKKVPSDAFVMRGKSYNMDIYGCIPDARGYEFGSEVRKSIPKVKTDDNALYAHIRSGDVFNKNPCEYYGQPPLCYYESIISKWGFKKVYIIAEDKKNPVINALIKKYKAKLIKKKLLTTIGYILSAKNLAISYGTFVPSLLNLMPDDIDHNFFKYGPYFGRNTNFRKKFYFTSVSDFYMKNIMSRNWKNTKEQRQMMLDEKCGDEWFFHNVTLQT